MMEQNRLILFSPITSLCCARAKADDEAMPAHFRAKKKGNPTYDMSRASHFKDGRRVFLCLSLISKLGHRKSITLCDRESSIITTHFFGA